MKIDMMEVMRSIRKPLPRQTGGPQGTKKGKRGYNRRGAKRELRRQVSIQSDRDSTKALHGL